MLFSCSNRTEELEARIAQLETELDDCKNGADKLYGFITTSFEKEDYNGVITHFKVLESKHPESKEFSLARPIFDKASAFVAKAEKDEVERKAKAEEEQRKQAEAAEAAKLASLKKLKKQFDDVSGTTWYKNPYFTHYTNDNRTSIYIGQKDGSVWMRLYMSYEGDDWIFFKNAYLSYDGKTLEIPFNDYEDKESENDGGSVWEWIDLSIDESTIGFMEKMAKSPNAKMRLSGKYTKTRNLTTNERKGITDVINGYRALKSQ